MKHKRHPLRIALLLFGVVVLLAIGVWIFKFITEKPLVSAPSNPPQFITANAANPDQIYAISRFRSGAGHDYSTSSWDGETCRSMKNYFNFGLNTDANGNAVRSQPTTDHPNITIYAPMDGKIIEDQPSHIGSQVSIQSSRYPAYVVTLDHIDLTSAKLGAKVTSGQPIGSIGPKDGIDYDIRGTMLSGKTYYVSVFQAMTDQVFSPYASLGFQRSDFIISKSDRDAHPLTCGAAGGNGNQGFVRSPDYNITNDYVFLRPSPFGPISGPNGPFQIHIGPPTQPY